MQESSPISQIIAGSDMRKMSKSSRSQPSLGIIKKTQLIERVKIRPCLWDHRCEEFKSSAARQSAFLEIVHELSDGDNQYTRTQIQEEWGKIRYCFTRIMKKFLTTDDDADAVSWPHWQDMQFMYSTIKDHLLSAGQNDPPTSSSAAAANNNNSALLRTRNMRKRRHTRAAPSRTHQTNSSSRQRASQSSASYSNVAASSSSAAMDASAAADAPISSAAAKALYDLGLNPTMVTVSTTPSASVGGGGTALVPRVDELALTSALIKAENFTNAVMSEAMEDGGRFLASVSPATEKGYATNWDTFLSAVNSGNCARNDALSALAFPINDSMSSSKASHLPTSSSCSTNINGVVLNGNGNGGDFRSGLPSIESNDAALSKNVASSGDAERDTNEFFGKYMIQQMKSVSQRNATLGVLLRKELMEVCCKYELQTFS